MEAVAVAVVRLRMSEHGLVGSARSSLGECPTLDASQQQAEVGISTAANSASTFCTDASQAGQLYIGVYAEPEMNNVSLPPRHWYTFRLDHTVFDTSDLDSGEMRTGCLAYGQWRHYRISTLGINDARLDLAVNLGVTALYARRGARPTATDHDARAAWPLRRLSLTHCDVAAETNWYVAVYLGAEAEALAAEPALQRLGGSDFKLNATLRTSNVSLAPLPRGTQQQVPPAYVCCGNYHDYIVPRVSRTLALRVEIKVHSGHLSAIYLKHAACARYPDDVGPDEQCVGNCEMGWLTTFNQFTLEPSYAEGVVLTVPMGTFSPDIRAAGDWYISIAGPVDGSVASYSLVTELVESPIISQFIPLDAAQAEQEKCGRFCVVLSAPLDDFEEEGYDVSAADSRRHGASAALSLLLLTTGATLTLLTHGSRRCSGAV